MSGLGRDRDIMASPSDCQQVRYSQKGWSTYDPSLFWVPLIPDDVWVHGGVSSTVLSPSNPSNPLPTTLGPILHSSTLAISSSVAVAPSTAPQTPCRRDGRLCPRGSAWLLLLLFLPICFLRRCYCSQCPHNYRREPTISQVIWMWRDVNRTITTRIPMFDTQLHSAGEGSPQSSGDEHDVFIRHSRNASHGTTDT
jgi:hypothetical protein